MRRATREVTAPVLRQVVDVARLAPSIHNTQPWAWTGHGGALELWADRSRRLPATDPQGRHLHVSCGAALHHAVVAATAVGLEVVVRRFPDPDRPQLLARIELRHGDLRTSPELLEAVHRRRTDHRRFTAWPVPPERMARLARGASRPGAEVVPVLEPVARLRVERLVEHTRVARLRDPVIRAEAGHWLEQHGEDPDAHDAMSVRVSDGLAVLATATDDAAAWVATGEVLSSLWLQATVEDLTLVPMSQVVEHSPSRHALVHQLPEDLPHPQLLARLGWQMIGRSTLPRTRRRSLAEVYRASAART